MVWRLRFQEVPVVGWGRRDEGQHHILEIKRRHEQETAADRAVAFQKSLSESC